MSGGNSICLSVFLPCYNEEANFNNVVRKVLRVLNGTQIDYELIIVDDGSADKTGQNADQLTNKNSSIKVIHHTFNLGYGAALKSGFKTASKELIFYMDGDGQFDISYLPPLLSLMNKYDVVSCYRLNG